ERIALQVLRDEGEGAGVVDVDAGVEGVEGFELCGLLAFDHARHAVLTLIEGGPVDARVPRPGRQEEEVAGAIVGVDHHGGLEVAARRVDEGYRGEVGRRALPELGEVSSLEPASPFEVDRIEVDAENAGEGVLEGVVPPELLVEPDDVV